MEIKEKIARVEALANQDPLYQYLMNMLTPLEEDVNLLTEKLSLKRRAILWDFVMHCEEISRRKLEIACEHMEFRD